MLKSFKQDQMHSVWNHKELGYYNTRLPSAYFIDCKFQLANLSVSFILKYFKLAYLKKKNADFKATDAFAKQYLQSGNFFHAEIAEI